jgi:hypothetical protein
MVKSAVLPMNRLKNYREIERGLESHGSYVGFRAPVTLKWAIKRPSLL